MAQYISPTPETEVNRRTVGAVVEAMDRGKDTRIAIMSRNGVDMHGTDEWFSHQKWLDGFREIGESLGDMNLFIIGKAIIEHAEFPPINSLEEGLRSIDVAYHINHRLHGKPMFDPATGTMTEGIGHYLVTEFDGAKRKAVMVCDNPYPSKFDEGIITQVVRKFKPLGGLEKIELDATKETRLKGADSCTYLITW